MTYSGFASEFVLKEFITKGMCLIAVIEDGYSLKYVPEEFITKNICSIAIKNNKNALQLFIPQEFQ